MKLRSLAVVLPLLAANGCKDEPPTIIVEDSEQATPAPAPDVVVNTSVTTQARCETALITCDRRVETGLNLCTDREGRLTSILCDQGWFGCAVGTDRRYYACEKRERDCREELAAGGAPANDECRLTCSQQSITGNDLCERTRVATVVACDRESSEVQRDCESEARGAQNECEAPVQATRFQCDANAQNNSTTCYQTSRSRQEACDTLCEENFDPENPDSTKDCHTNCEAQAEIDRNACNQASNVASYACSEAANNGMDECYLLERATREQCLADRSQPFCISDADLEAQLCRVELDTSVNGCIRECDRVQGDPCDGNCLDTLIADYDVCLRDYTTCIAVGTEAGAEKCNGEAAMGYTVCDEAFAKCTAPGAGPTASPLPNQD